MEENIEKPKTKKSEFTKGVVLATVGVSIGAILGNSTADKINERRDLKKVVADSEIICNEENNNIYELKRTFEPGEHHICYSYIRTTDSLGVLDIDIPEGYEIVSNDAKKIRVNGTQYYQIIVKYENTVTVVANGLYNPKDNQIEYLEAGAPVDTLKLSLK